MMITISLLATMAWSCGKNDGDKDGDTSEAATEEASEGGDNKSDSPSSEKNESTKPDNKKTKDPKDKTAKGPKKEQADPASGKPKAGGQHCRATFEDGYWKVWGSGNPEPELPASGPAPADACTVETSTDVSGGSTNGQPAGNQRVLLKTSEGCYVPNGGGPAGLLLGACTGLTWRVPY